MAKKKELSESDDIISKLASLNTLLDQDEESEARKVFKEIYRVHDYEVDGKRSVGTVSCGSIKTDTARALYRLLFLLNPKRVDFSDMYKSDSLFAIVSPDGQFVADVQFFKYELAIYFSAAPTHVTGSQRNIRSGIPGVDNGVRAQSPELRAWCETLQKCLARTWMVYGGNDFEV